MESIAAVQSNIDNVSKMVEDAEHYKERMLKMKETLVKERGEVKELKRKHEPEAIPSSRIRKICIGTFSYNHLGREEGS